MECLSLKTTRLTYRLKLIVFSAIIFVGVISYVSIRIALNVDDEAISIPKTRAPISVSSKGTLSAPIDKLKELEANARRFIFKLPKQTCSFPKRSPFHNPLKIKTLEDKMPASCGPTHTQFHVQNRTFSMRCLTNSQVPMFRAGPHSYNSFNPREWKIFPYGHDGYIHMPNLDLVETACVDIDKRISYHNYHVQVVRDEELIIKRKRLTKKFMKRVKKKLNQTSVSQQGAIGSESTPKRPVDIIVIVIDSVSRAFFQRHFPHTKQIIEELVNDMPNSNYSVVELKNYHVLGWNSYPNMHALVTSFPFVQLSESKDPISWISKFRVDTGIKTLPLLWDHLMKIGYVTSVGEDAGDSPHTAGAIYGYKDSRLTYDVYPAYQRVAFMTHYLGHNFNYEPTACPCVGDRFMSNVVYEFSKSFLKQYTEVPKFLMVVQDEAHDTVGNQVLALDPDLAGYLRWLKTSGRLDNTAVVLMADHGSHYGPLYTINQTQAIAEHESPFSVMILPNHIARNSKIFSNADRLVNVKDFHMTIRDIATFPRHSTKHDSRKDALSLLHDDIPEQRTCEDMLVPQQFRKTCKKPN